MDNLSRQQSSSTYYERNHSGCMWGLLHFFEFYHRHRMRKRLAYRKDDDGDHADGVKIAKANQNILSNGEDHALLEGEKNSSIDEKSRSSGKARMKFLFSKMSRKKEKKRKISPLASRLMRTASIHYLECNDYVLADDMTSGSKASTTDLSSHETDSSASTEHVQQLPKGPDGSYSGEQREACGDLNTMFCNKLDEFGDHMLEKQAILIERLNEAKDSLLKQEGRDARKLERNVSLQQSNEFSDLLELLNANRELFLKFLQDPTYVLANYLHVPQSSNVKAALTKSGSFPDTGYSRRTMRGLVKLQDRQEEIEDCSKLQDKQKEIADCSHAVTLVSGTRENSLKPHHKIMTKSRSGSSLEVLPNFPDELKNQREGATISGFKDLKQRIKDVMNENRKGQHRISLDGILHKIPYGQKVSEDLKKEILRDGPALNRDRSVFANGKFAHKGIRRSHSLTDSLGSYSRLLESSSFKESKRLPERSKLTQEDGLQNRKSPKTFGRLFSNPEFGSFLPTMDLLVSDVAVADKTASLAASVHEDESVASVASVENISEVICNDTTDQDLEQPLLINKHEPSKLCEGSDLKADGSSSDAPLREEIGNDLDQCDKPTKPSPVSVPDSCQEDPVNPVEYCAIEDSKLKSRCIDNEELSSVANPQNQLDLAGSEGMETVKSDSGIVHMPVEPSDSNAFHVYVDKKDEAEFNYVMGVLKKSGFCSEVIHGDGFLPYVPVDPVLFGGAEGSSYDLETEIDGSEMSRDNQHLFDLMNEVLLEIYENSFSHYPGFSWNNNSRIRPLPVGYHVLEEVWSKISWHLNSQKQQDPTFEDAVARNFAGNDGWLNLHWDTESVGLELEDWILDDLLDEVVLQCGSLASECVVS